MHPGTRPRAILGSGLPRSGTKSPGTHVPSPSSSPSTKPTPLTSLTRTTSPAKRRAALAAFLRDRRAKLAPAHVGLPSAGRRRTPGLRREEVAQLAGVSVAWYTWLEQGRDIRPSLDALDAIIGALRLGAEDRLHAFALAGHGAPEAPPLPPPIAAPPGLQAVLDALAFPAYASDRAWNIVAWNQLANQIFGYTQRAPADRNPLLILFGDPAFRAMLLNAAGEMAHLVANFRRAADEAGEDPAFEAVLVRLRAHPEFARLWARHDVKRRHVAHKQLRHPALGELTFDTQSFLSATTGLRVVVYVPDAATAPKLTASADRAPARRDPRAGSRPRSRSR